MKCTDCKSLLQVIGCAFFFVRQLYVRAMFRLVCSLSLPLSLCFRVCLSIYVHSHLCIYIHMDAHICVRVYGHVYVCVCVFVR